MELQVQLLMNTLQIGSVYVLFALGLTLIFGVMKIVNFAHGTFFTAAALIVSTIMIWGVDTMGLSIWLSYLIAFVLALLVVCLIGFVVYVFGFQYFLKDLNGSFILSIGLLLLLNGTYLILYGGVPRSVPDVIPGNITILGASLTLQRLLLMIVAAIITLGLYILVHRTRTQPARRRRGSGSGNAAGHPLSPGRPLWLLDRRDAGRLRRSADGDCYTRDHRDR